MKLKKAENAHVWLQSTIITSYRWCDGYGKLKLWSRLKNTVKR